MKIEMVFFVISAPATLIMSQDLTVEMVSFVRVGQSAAQLMPSQAAAQRHTFTTYFGTILPKPALW